MPRNRLAAEISPYLLQHADNPVDWWPWGEAALAEAQRTGKPILLSVGYAACHWCHVMAHECFETPAIAAVMNRLFVNIKVDREERPDIDYVYQSALAFMGLPGGWPLTMFLTPQGEPFWGGTYFPPEPRYGRPGFVQVLEQISDIYRRQPQRLTQNRSALMAELRRLSQGAERQPLPPHFLDRTAERILALVDPRHGGLGDAPKFPQPYLFELLWRAYLRGGATPFRDAVMRTLDHLCQGGIYDHLAGGFARYAVDARWMVPHFEKMLYDNALILRLLTLVWQETRTPLYAERIAETIAWLARDMRTAGGAFAASLDADSEGEEGKYYVWSPAELRSLLPPEDGDLFARVYGVRADGNWQGVNILHRLDAMTPLSDAEEARLAQCRQILFRARSNRVAPARDDKVLADWNGLAVRAIAEAAMAFARPEWLDLARTAFAFVRDRMQGADGRILHAARAGRNSPVSLLDDHAQMIAAALTLFEAGAGRACLERAVAWAEIVERLFADSDGGGYFTTPSDAPALILRPKSAHDGAQPSANGTMLENFARLFLLTGERHWRSRAERLLAAFSGELAGNSLPLAALCNGYDTLIGGFSVTLSGSCRNRAFLALERIAWQTSLATAARRAIPDLRDLPADDPVREQPVPAVAAIICSGSTCSAPYSDPEALRQALIQQRKTAS